MSKALFRDPLELARIELRVSDLAENVVLLRRQQSHREDANSVRWRMTVTVLSHLPAPE